MKLHIDQSFSAVTLERFVEVYFSEDFNNAVAPVSGLRSRQLVEEKIDTDGVRHRRVRMRPKVTLPGALKKFVSEEQIHYDEVSTYDPIRHEVRFHIDSAGKDRVSVGGTIRFIATGEGVRRIIDYDIDVKAPFGVGLIVEKFIEAEVQKGYGRLATFLQDYLDNARKQDKP